MGKNTHTHTNISSISLLQSNLKTNQQSKQIRSSTTIMSASTVNVKNISSATSEKEIKDFFSFCGKISSIEVTESGESKCHRNFRKGDCREDCPPPRQPPTRCHTSSSFQRLLVHPHQPRSEVPCHRQGQVC